MHILADAGINKCKRPPSTYAICTVYRMKALVLFCILFDKNLGLFVDKTSLQECYMYKSCTLDTIIMC